MVQRNLPWILLGLAVLLAMIAIAVSGFGAYPDPPHNPFEHVGDSHEWHIFESRHISIPLGWLSKFMILELIAAGLTLAIFIPLSRRLAGQLPRGARDNSFDALLAFIRNDIAKPNLGEEDADKYVPLLWTLFFFILFNNLLGMLPWMGSPTANLYVTGALALISFIVMHGAAIYKMGGPGRYFKAL